MHSQKAVVLLEKYAHEELLKLHFFRLLDEIPIPTFLEGSKLFQDNTIIHQFLKDRLIVERTPIASYFFYRERMEDYIFVNCDLEIAEISEKIEKLGSRLKKQRLRLHAAIDQIKEFKQICTILFRYSVKILANERYADYNSTAKNMSIKILSSYNIHDNSLLPEPNFTQGKKYFQAIKQKGFWVEFSPEPCYLITDMGLEILRQFHISQEKKKDPEEAEFEKIVAEMNRLDAKKFRRK